MTMPEYISKMQELAAISAEAAIIPAANEMLAEIKNRIVIDGKGSSGNQIGQYSTKAAYFSQQQFDKKGAFKPRGKVRTNTKTMYLPAGYKELRDIQGKPTDNIKVNYTGSTMAAYQQAAVEGGVVQGLTTERAKDIREGQERKRGNIFAPTKDELDIFNKNVAKEIAGLQIKILTS